jgi:hypothetical protein
MEGIVDGIQYSDGDDGEKITINDIIMWNCYLMIDSMFSSIRELLLKNANIFHIFFS